MHISSNSRNYNYKFESGQFNLTGNHNKLNLQNCQAQVKIFGDENLIKINRCLIYLQIIGNGNKLTFIGCSQIDLGVQGSKNHVNLQQVQGQRTKLYVYKNTGLGNTFPITHELDYRNPFYKNQNKLEDRNNIRQETRDMRVCYPFYSNYCYNPSPGQTFFSYRLFRESLFQRSNQNSPGYHFNSSPLRVQAVRQSFRQEGRQSFREEVRQAEIKSQGLLKQQLQTLPITFHKGEQSPICVICLDSMSHGDKVIFLICCHPFHSDCITDWLEKNETCPICLTNIKKHLKN